MRRIAVLAGAIVFGASVAASAAVITRDQLAQFFLERNKPEEARQCQEEATRQEQAAAKLLAEVQSKK